MSRSNSDGELSLGVIAAIAVVILLVVGSFCTWLFFMHSETVEPGHELVINDKPYFFGHGGVREDTVKEGRILLFNTSSAIAVNMTPQSFTMSLDDFSSSDNILLDFETSIQYRYTNARDLIAYFDNHWFENTIQRQYISIVRDIVKTKTMSQMMSDPSTAAAVDASITEAVQKLVKESKLPVNILGISLGRAKPNENVLAQMNETAQQQQREKTLVAAERAEQSRKREQIAKAAADNAYREEMHLSPEQFLALEQAKMYSEACQVQGSTCIITSGQQPIVLGHK